MNPWVIALILCIVVILVLAFYLVSILSSVRELTKQLEYIGTNRTNMSLSIGASTRSVRKLTDMINRVIVNCRNRELETSRKDDEIKETITSMSHDIRTPLTSLKGYFDLMCDSDSEEDKERYKGIISERIDSLSEMLEEMFIYTKINNSNYKLENERTNISEVMISSLLSYYEDFEKKNMTPNIDVDENLFAVTDEQALKRVFQNLIKNSLIHGENSFDVSLKRSEGKKIRISVGNGIKEVERPDVTRVFDRFYKGDSSRHVNSSGIGLSVTQKLVNLMGGSIEAVLKEDKFVINIFLDELSTHSKIAE
ncbi:MAG: HAMP domain-containing histidine kinase [Clostridiales bacterium]|nr:HAMP domain-containing histidine kinase [Clostridiales bacterium]